MADPIKLTVTEQRFILHWGEMGTRWGINRTVAQVQAFLFLAPRPVHAEEIQEALAVARSNVSNSLKELQGWGIIRRVHLPGDRRDHFESLGDVWELFRIVLDERKKREIDPTLAVLKECIEAGEKDRHTPAESLRRMRDLHEFFSTTTLWYDQVRRWPAGAIRRLVKLGDKAIRLLGLD